VQEAQRVCGNGPAAANKWSPLRVFCYDAHTGVVEAVLAFSSCSEVES
jgi:hypothetical protein